MARAEITQSFHAAFDGAHVAGCEGRPFQAGDTLRDLRRDVLAFAEEHGYTAEQLAGTKITILDVRFIDETHAAVRFTLTTPGRGDVMVDKAGYAVFDGGRWKVEGGRSRCVPPAICSRSTA